MYFNAIPKVEYDSMNTGEPKIVTNLLRRVAVRAKIKTNTLLFDTKEFTKQIERSYTEIYERYQLGSKPDHIYLNK